MQIITKNKHVFSDYEIFDTYDTGIVLAWHEVKSIKNKQVNIKDAIVILDEKELIISNMDVPLYSKTNINTIHWSYEPKWKRKLLITKKELSKIFAKTTKTWLSIIPLQVFTTDRGLIKITIGVGKLKRKVDKKETIKTRDRIREMEREIKEYK